MYFIVIFGRVATGKTVLSDALRQRLDPMMFRKDDVKELAFRFIDPKDAAQGHALSELSIALCCSFAADAAARRIPCLLEGNFERRTIEALLENLPEDVPVALIKCSASDGTIRRRFLRREVSGGRHVGHRGIEVLQRMDRAMPPGPEWPESARALRIDYQAGRRQLRHAVLRVDAWARAAGTDESRLST